jgi:hypothetical protein
MALADGAALLLYGRIGSYARRAADTPAHDQGSLALWRNCADSILKNVVEPWRSAGRLDVFVQSWNPELQSAMDAFWQPAASWHGAQNSSFKCPTASAIGFCERTYWAMLGMRHAIELRSAWSRADSSSGAAARVHGTVIMMRHDLFWFNELPVVRASPTARLWLPFNCQTRDVTAATTPRGNIKGLHMKGPFGQSSTSATMTSVAAASEIFGHNCNLQRDSPDRLGFCDLTIEIDW